MKTPQNKALNSVFRVDNERLASLKHLNKGARLNILKNILSNLSSLAATIERGDVSAVINAIITGSRINMNVGRIMVAASFSDKPMNHIRGFGYPTTMNGSIPVWVNLVTGTFNINGLGDYTAPRISVDDVRNVVRIPLDINEYSPERIMSVISDILHMTRTLATAIMPCRFDIMSALDSICEELENPLVEFNITQHQTDVCLPQPFAYSHNVRGICYYPHIILHHTTQEIELRAVSNRKDEFPEIFVGKQKYIDLAEFKHPAHLSAFTGG